MGLNKVNNNDYSSDYGSGGSSSSPWASQHDIRWTAYSHQHQRAMERPTQKSSSYSDLAMGRCTLEDVMRDFQMNGSDSPYNPDEDQAWGKYPELSGMGPTGGYLRQKSWPAPERSPAACLPAAPPVTFATSTPVFDAPAASFEPEAAPARALTAAQARVLASLPSSVLNSLIRQLQYEKRSKALQFQECRFCKNNGEREAYYRSHALKDARGRVACPVLRAFVCARCGARGDSAHTIKYCPLSTNEERIKSAAMMRSVRMASGRRRAPLAPSLSAPPDYVVFGEAPPAVLRDNSALASYGEAPLDPQWAALEQKLML